MDNRLDAILKAADKDALNRLSPPLNLTDLFMGESPAITHPGILSRMRDIVEILAQNDQLITAADWCEREYGDDKRQSVRDLAEKLGVDKGLVIQNGYLCTANTKEIAETFPPPNYDRHGLIYAARPDDDAKFWRYCNEDDLDCARKLLQHTYINLEHANYSGSAPDMRTPLMLASGRNQSQWANELIGAGADPDARSTGNYSPLLIATRYGNDDIAEILLDALCKRYMGLPAKLLNALTCQGNNGNTPLGNAQQYCSDKVEKRLEALIDEAKAKFAARSVQDVAAAAKDEAYDAVASLFAALGTKDIRARILKQQPIMGTLFGHMIEFKMLDKLMPALHAAGERLSNVELIQREEGSMKGTYLERIIATNQLSELLKPEYWVGHMREMRELWERVPAADRTQMDGKEGRQSFKQAYQAANAASARMLGGGAEGVGR